MKLPSSAFGALRLSFLARFAVATFLAAVLASAALAAVVIDLHTTALETNEGVNAAGQVGEIFTQPLSNVSRTTLGRGGTKELRLAEDAAKRIQFVDGVRIYRYDGAVLFPRDAPSDVADVRATLQSGSLWSRRFVDSAGQERLVQYLPFATSKSIFVLAIDLSYRLMNNQARTEGTAIVGATAGALAIVFISLVALAAGASRELEMRRREAQGTFVKTLTLLAETIDRRDPYTAGHSSRVAEYSRKLAVALKLPRRDCDVIEHAALLHDLGKIGIPDSVLLKPGKLNAEEREIIEHHPVIGGEILSNISTMGDIAPCVFHHHERLDGKGYPAGLAGADIPVGSRVIAVADTFDAMTTDRPYRRALSSEAALSEMRRVSGTQLEAAYVDAFSLLVARGAIVPPEPALPGESLANRFGAQVARVGVRLERVLEIEHAAAPGRDGH